MSYQTAKWQDLWADTDSGVFSMWYIDNTPNLYLPQGASPYLRNARLDGNTVNIRPWHRLFKTLSSTGKGMWAYLMDDEFYDTIVVRENVDTGKKLAKYKEDWTKTEINTGANITSDNRMCFVSVADTMYCMNGSDAFWKLVDTTYSIPSNVPTNFAPKFWVVFNGCLWTSWWSSNPNVVYKSLWGIYNSSGKFIAPAYDDFTTTGSDQFTFEENITGLCANAQALFYFTRNTVSVTGHWDIETVEISSGWSRVAYTTTVLTAKEWAINHESIVWVGNDVFYVTPSNKICKIYRWNNVYGYEVQDLSGRKYAWCEWLLKSLAKNQSDCWGYYVPSEDLIKWFFKSEWSSVHDICVVYDVTKDKFLIDTGKPFYYGISFHNAVYTLSEVEAKMYQDEIWTEDDDMPVPFEYWTKEFYISDPSFKKIFWETRTTLDMNLNAELLQEIWVDGKQVDSVVVDKTWLQDTAVGWIWTYATGTAMVWVDIEADAYVEGLDYSEIFVMRTKWNLNTRWHKIQFRFSNTTEWAKVRLKYLSCKSEILPELTNRLK